MLDGLLLDHSKRTLLHACGTQRPRNNCSLHVNRWTTVRFHLLLL